MRSERFGVPEVIRTPDLPLRRQSLYPAELRKHNLLLMRLTERKNHYSIWGRKGQDLLNFRALFVVLDRR